MTSTEKLPDDTMLRGLAEMAFGLGLVDGENRKTPRTGEGLKGALEQAYMHSLHGISFRRIHGKKMRQVYGAGFDIAQTQKAIRVLEGIK